MKSGTKINFSNLGWGFFHLAVLLLCVFTQVTSDFIIDCLTLLVIYLLVTKPAFDVHLHVCNI